MKPIILHISNDYPDPLIPAKTRAVISLVEGAPQYRHIVYSLNRVTAMGGVYAVPFGEDRTALAYGALPKGIFWENRLGALAKWILDDLRRKGIKPDIIEAHKFTIEGVIGLSLAKEFSVPLICDIQGGSDVRILKLKKSLRGVYEEIAKKSAAIFPYAPWSADIFTQELGLDRGKCHNLPVISGIDTMLPAPVVAAPRFMSVFHLDSWDRKNFIGMCAAMKTLRGKIKGITLDIYGRGSPETLLKLGRYIDKNGLSDCVTLKGGVENGRLQEVMQAYVALILPSKIETYGLVYAEALFSGLPILLNKAQGISGYLDIAQVGYGCDLSDQADMARGISSLWEGQKHLKKNIAQMQKRGAFDFMRRHAILKTYAGVIDSVLAKR